MDDPNTGDLAANAVRTESPAPNPAAEAPANAPAVPAVVYVKALQLLAIGANRHAAKGAVLRGTADQVAKLPGAKIAPASPDDIARADPRFITLEG